MSIAICMGCGRQKLKKETETEERARSVPAVLRNENGTKGTVPSVPFWWKGASLLFRGEVNSS